MEMGKLFTLILLACVMCALASCPNPGTPAQMEQTAEIDPGPAHIEMNAKTGAASLAFGMKSQTYGSAGKRFLRDQQETLCIDPAKLELVSERTSKLKDQRYVTYRQLYKGVPVWGSFVGYTVKSSGLVPILGAAYYPDIDINVAPTLSEMAAGAAAVRASAALARGAVSNKGGAELFVLPVEKENGYVYQLVYRVTTEGKVFSRTFLIDALSGRVITHFSNIKNDASGQVKLQYWSPNKNGQVREFAGWGGGQVILHSFSSDIGYRAYYATCNLDGTYYFPESGFINYVQADIGPGALTNAWATIDDITLPRESHFDLTFDWTWTVSRASNVFVRMNKMHDYIDQFTDACDVTMLAEVSFDEFTSAFSNGEKMGFGWAYGLDWAAADDVVYHEYAHNAIYRVLGHWINQTREDPEAAAMDEGLADYFAASITASSKLGEYLDPSYPARELYNKRTWDPNETNPHTNGMVIGGACWDLRRYLGQATADRLVFEAIEMSPEADTFAEFARNVAIADDNDGNLSNGVPHGYSINRAFETNHGINFPWY